VTVLVAMAAVATGCGGLGASPTAPASNQPTEPGAAARACVDVALRDPNGEPVFLTGRWVGSGDPNALPAPSVFLLRQTNSCLVWVGLSAEEGEALGASWIESFAGEIRPDFTVVGLWEEVPDGARGMLTAAIEFMPGGNLYEVEIALADSSGDVHRIERWVREVAN